MTITGTGFVQAGQALVVTVDGEDVTDTYVTAVTPTTITLAEFPVAGGARNMDITVDVGGGATSETVAYAFGGEDTEPANDNFVDVTLPFDHTGWFGGSDDYDFFEFVAPTTGTLTLFVDWDDADLDLDIALYNATTGSFISSCLSGASAAKPETDTSCNVTAGTRYGIYINDYSISHDGITTPTQYHATASYNP